MYNEEQKQKFISGYTKSLHTAEVASGIFEAISPYEETHEKDLCAMSVDELQPIVDNVLGLRISSKWMGITILREYSRWCMASNIPDAKDSIANVSLLGLEKIRTQMVSSPLHLQKYLSEVFDPEEDETIDNIYRCFFWFGYAGIPEEDTLQIKNGDIDFAGLTIRYGEDELPIFREAIPAFRNAVQLSAFQYKHPNYSKTVVRDRVHGDTVMRGIKANVQILTIRSTLSKRLTEAFKKGKTKQQLSFYRIWLSGLFYRMYELERAGIPADFSEVAMQNMAGKTYSLEGGATLVQKQNRKAKDYMNDYQRWKLAFSI